MSETEVQVLEDAANQGPNVSLFREVNVRIAEGDGRTLIAQLVPYNVEAMVSDGGEPYREMFLPGAFSSQTRAAHRIKAFLNFRHRQGLTDVIGHATKVTDSATGLQGELRVLENQDGDKALQLVNAGVLDKLSIEFHPLKARVVDGVVQRVKAHLVGVALVPEGSYEGAAVLAVREAEIREELEKWEPDPVEQDLIDKLSRFVDIPQELTRAFTDQSWDGSAGRWPDAASYCRSCLIDDNPAGQEKSKALCHLPIREPSGAININAVRNALARVGQVQTSAENKARARRRLEALLAQFNNQQGKSE